MSTRNGQSHVGEPGYELTSDRSIVIQALNSESEWLEDFKRVLSNPEVGQSSEVYRKVRKIYEDMESEYGARDGIDSETKADALEEAIGVWDETLNSVEEFENGEQY